MTTRADTGGVIVGGEQGAEWLSWRQHRRRIYLLVLLAAIAVAASLAVFALRPLHGEITGQARAGAETLLDQSARLFAAESRLLLRRAEAVATSLHGELDTADAPSLARRLASLIGGEPNLVGLAVLEVDGKLLAAAGQEMESADQQPPVAGLRPVKLPLNDAGLLFTLPLRDPSGRRSHWLQVTFDAAPLRELLAKEVGDVPAPFVVWNDRMFFSAGAARMLAQTCGGVSGLLKDGCGGRVQPLECPLEGADWRLVLPLDGAAGSERVAIALRWLPEALLCVALVLAVVTLRVIRPLNLLFARTAQLYELSAQDELTGLSNRRHLMEALDKELARAGRHGLSLNVLLLDIDRFKLINDTHGHAVGDSAIKSVGESVLRLSRGEDVTARLGGDEFVVVQTDVDLQGAMRFAERLRQAIGRLQVDAHGDWVSLSVSIGLAHVPAGMVPRVSRDRVMGMADRALYKAKAAGRNQVKARGLRSVRQAVSSSD